MSWLRDRPYYRRQIKAQWSFDDRTGTAADLHIDSHLDRALERRGIDQFYQHQVSAIESIRDG